jgi:ADP-ribosylation factor protein 1
MESGRVWVSSVHFPEMARNTHTTAAGSNDGHAACHCAHAVLRVHYAALAAVIPHCAVLLLAGFNVEHVAYKNIDMTMWDVGGQTKLRHLWHHYYEGSHALIYVVDSNDTERLEEAREELRGILDSDAFPSDAVVLVYANKQDLPSASPPSDVAAALGLPDLRRKWFVQGGCATTGDGLFEGMEWLASTLNERKG